MNNWLRPSMQIPRYISLMIKAMFKPTMDTQEAIKQYWDTYNSVIDQESKKP